MGIKIFNTKTGRKAPFSPIEPGHIKLYVCGITAYDYCHIGHARSALVFDMIYRYFLHRGFKVTYIRNFTDIDDKIINRANEQNTSTVELSERFITAFHEDMDRLGVAAPTIEPKATEHVDEIIRMIEELINKGLAYAVGNDVFYSVDNFAHYGELSGRKLEDMQAGARISINENKQNPMDFALWKSSKPGEPAWDSPWGMGRPGWHIECSAMSRKYLGDSFDIHGGGKDLIFPHHENEIAQSEGATGKTFVQLWIHHGFVTIKDEKMSKSLGNFLTIRDVLREYEPETLRLFVFSSHYRTPLDFSENNMKEAVAGLDRLYTCLAEIKKFESGQGSDNVKQVSTAKDTKKILDLATRFQSAMDNDFNTAQALGHLFDTAKTLNKIRLSLPSSPNPGDLELLRKGSTAIQNLAGILGLLREDPTLFLRRKQNEMLSGLDINATEIEQLIQKRLEARNNKDWGMADSIRDLLQEKNIEIKDGPEGTTWQVKV